MTFLIAALTGLILLCAALAVLYWSVSALRHVYSSLRSWLYFRRQRSLYRAGPLGWIARSRPAKGAPSLGSLRFTRSREREFNGLPNEETYRDAMGAAGLGRPESEE